MAAKKHFHRNVPGVGGVAAVALIAAAAIYFVYQFVQDTPEKAKKVVHEITLLQAPPPPPPPKVEEPPPEPEVEEKVDLPEPEMPEAVPETAADQPPAGDSLGLDSDGGAGGDGFGLVGRRGGRDLIGGGSGSEMARFGLIVKNDIQSFLSAIDDIRKQGYDVKIRLWFDAQGYVKKFKLLETTGDPKTDESLKLALAKYERFPDTPPDEKKNFLTIRITSRI